MHEPSWGFRAIIHAGFVNVTPLMAWLDNELCRDDHNDHRFSFSLASCLWLGLSEAGCLLGWSFCILQAALRSKHYTEVIFHCETARNLLHVATGSREYMSTKDHKSWFGTPFFGALSGTTICSQVCARKPNTLSLPWRHWNQSEQGRSGGKKFPTFVQLAEKSFEISSKKNDIACLICLVRSSCC